MTHRADLVCDMAGEQMLVRVRGEIDHHTAADIRNSIDSALFEKRPRRLILDMSAVTFMDSSGLGLIMGRLSVIRQLGGELVVQDPSDAISRIITLAGMERTVNIRRTNGGETVATNAKATARRRRKRVSSAEGKVVK